VWNAAITGEANKSRLVVYKQTEQEFTLTNKKNTIANTFQKMTTFTTITCCYKFVIQLLHWTVFVVGVVIGFCFLSSNKYSTQQFNISSIDSPLSSAITPSTNSIPADDLYGSENHTYVK